MAVVPTVLIKYLGHATFLITTPGGKKLLIDPWVQNNPACCTARVARPASGYPSASSTYHTVRLRGPLSRASSGRRFRRFVTRTYA